MEMYFLGRPYLAGVVDHNTVSQEVIKYGVGANLVAPQIGWAQLVVNH